MKHILWLLLLLFSTFSQAEEGLLPADEAFAFKAKVVNNNIILNWDIAKGYYLYKEKINISSDFSAQLGVAKFPPAKIKDDEFFGKMGIYRHQTIVTIPVLKGDATSLLLNVTFQGCADLGVCYPPITKTAALDISAMQAPSIVDNAFKFLSKAKQSTQSIIENIVPISNEPLAADEAFKFSVEALDAKNLLVSWDIHSEYYLYHDKFFIDAEGAEIDKVDFPKGKIKDDPLFGKVQIHKGRLTVKVPLRNIQKQTINFTAKYQGCWAGGICYPPQEKNVSLTLPKEIDMISQATTITSATTPLKPNVELNATDKISALLQQDDIFWILISFFGFGLLLSLTPCVFPMIPILSGIIVGQKGEVTTRKALVMSIVFVLAMSVTYAIAGVLAGYLVKIYRYYSKRLGCW